MSYYDFFKALQSNDSLVPAEPISFFTVVARQMAKCRSASCIVTEETHMQHVIRQK